MTTRTEYTKYLKKKASVKSTSKYNISAKTNPTKTKKHYAATMKRDKELDTDWSYIAYIDSKLPYA